MYVLFCDLDKFVFPEVFYGLFFIMVITLDSPECSVLVPLFCSDLLLNSKG